MVIYGSPVEYFLHIYQVVILAQISSTFSIITSTLMQVLALYYNIIHRRRNRGGHGGQGPTRFQKMNFGPHSFGEVRGIVFSDLYGWKMQKFMQNYC